MFGSSHIRSVLIGVKYQNCCQTFVAYLLFGTWIGQIQSKLTYRMSHQYWANFLTWTRTWEPGPVLGNLDLYSGTWTCTRLCTQVVFLSTFFVFLST